uniref:Putative secreted protein n=1 Tax=Amblyomma triste TaxID=251400 RepID=A0A023GBT2_AMBTT
MSAILLFSAVVLSLVLNGMAYPGLCIPVDYCDPTCVVGYDTAGCEICLCPPCLPCPTDCYEPAPGCPVCAPLQDCFSWPFSIFLR